MVWLRPVAFALQTHRKYPSLEELYIVFLIAVAFKVSFNPTMSIYRF